MTTLWVLPNDCSHPFRQTIESAAHVCRFTGHPDPRPLRAIHCLQARQCEPAADSIEATGGAVVTISDAPGPRGGTWNQNGITLFSTLWSGISRVPSSGGTPVEITQSNASRGETSHRWPYFLPDGQHFLYLAANFISASSEVASIHLGALDSRDTKVLFQAHSNADYTSRLPNSKVTQQGQIN